MDEVIILKNISKYFKIKKSKDVLEAEGKSAKKTEKLQVLNNISFEVKKGEMFGIIGLNGSGKTTLLRTIAGIYTPDQGKIEIHGQLAPLLQIGAGLHNELNAKENIIISGMIYGMKKSEIKEKVDEVIKFAELEKFTKVKLKNYSSGMKARLAFSTVLQLDPDILLVDEILSVGDIAFRKKSFNKFLSFKERGKTILYTSHNLGSMAKMCDRVLLLDKGNMIMIDNPEKVILHFKEIAFKKNNKQ